MKFIQILLKEFRLVNNSRSGLFSIITMSLSILIIFHFAFEKNIELNKSIFIGIKWTILFLVSFIFIGQINWEERESGADLINKIYVSSLTRYFSKSLIIFFILILSEVFILFLCFFLFNFNQNISFYKEMFFFSLAALNLSFLGVSLSMISTESRLKEIILPLLLFPFSIPIFLFGITAEKKLIHMNFENLITQKNFLIMIFLSILYACLGILFEEISNKEN